MRKHYFLATAMALMLSGSMQAQSVRTRIAAPAQTSRISSVIPNAKSAVQSPVRHAVKHATPRLAPVLTEAMAVPTETLDTIFLTKYSTYTGDVLDNSTEYTYNEYGLRESERNITGVNDGITGGNKDKRYKYVIGDNHFWTSRETEVKVGEQWVFQDRIERDINAENQVLEERMYQWDDVSQKEYLSDSYKYDYAHEFVAEEFDEATQTYIRRKVRGICTDYAYYNPDGSIFAENRFQWLEPVQQYIETYRYDTDYDDRYEKLVAEILENDIVSRKYNNYSGVEELVSEDHRYYGDREGFLSIGYNSGELMYAEGMYDQIEKDKPSAGYTTRTHFTYDVDTDSWEAQYRLILKGLETEESTPVPGVDYERAKEYWAQYENEWLLDYKVEGTWLSDLLCRETTIGSFGEDDISYYLYNGKSERPEKVEFNADTQEYEIVSTESGELDGIKVSTTIHSYYNCQDELVRQFKIESNDFDPYTQHGYIPMIYRISEMKNGEWVLADSFENVEHGSALGDIRKVYKFNNDGNLLSRQEYTYYKGEERLFLEENIEYLSNGYRSTSVEYAYKRDGERRERSSSVSEHLQLANGDYQYTYTDVVDGTRSDGRKVVTPELIGIRYRYDEASDSYIETERECYDIVTVDEEKGLQTTIRRMMEGDKAVNVSKSVSMTDHSIYNGYEEEYEWDATTGKWRGISRYSNCKINFTFTPTPFKDPFAYDELFNNPYAPGYDQYEEEDVAMDRFNKEYYSWDDEKSCWIPEHVYVYELVSSTGTETVMIEKELRGTSSSITTYTVNQDAEGYLTSVETKLDEGEGSVNQTVQHKLTEYTRNEDGYVTEKIQTDLQDTSAEPIKEVYEYTPTRIYITSIENVKGEELFQISGREITAPDHALVAVYDLSGRQVAVGHGQLTLPAAGIYVVTCNGSSVKVSCR